jgi:hypothetical protein
MSTPTSVQIIPGNLVLSGNVDTNDTDNTFCIDRANGRVGIGQGLTSLVTDSTDSNVLQISGEVKATRFHGDGTGITGLTDSKWLEDDNDINDIYYSAGTVGIGGIPGTETLTVYGNLNLKNGGNLKLNDADAVFSNWTSHTDGIYRTTNVGIGGLPSDTNELKVHGDVEVASNITSSNITVDGTLRITDGSSDASNKVDISFIQETGTYLYNQTKLQAGDKEATDKFGQAVSLSRDGNTAIVGAFLEDTGGSDAGAAYIFTRAAATNLTLNNGVWTQQQKIQASDKEQGDYFGYSVSLSDDGNTAIVGANFEDTGLNDIRSNAGAAYIFIRSESGVWSEQQKIQASDRLAGDEFGASSAISGDGNTVIVGAFGEDTGGSYAGAAYIFTRSESGVWSEQQKIKALDKAQEDYFASAVSINGDGNTVIVGAMREDTGGSNAGAAYIFTRSESGVWSEKQKILASDKEQGDYFGYSVSISGDGNTAIVGARYEDTGGSDAGAAYIFIRSESGVWSEQQKIQASDKQASDEFGRSCSISEDGNTAIVGSPGDFRIYSNGYGADAGAAYLYIRDVNGVWSQRQKITGHDAQAGDEFGMSTAISGDGITVLVGANLEDTGGDMAGAAYTYQFQIYKRIKLTGGIRAPSSIVSFTGQHICFPEGSVERGLIVSANRNKFMNLNGPLSTGLSAIKSSESLPIVSLSNVMNDTNIFGVVDSVESASLFRTQIVGGTVSENKKESGDNRVIVNSLGEGAMWVVNTNGNISSGDYITTSNINGYGHKQDDDILHSYTVAKITMDCDFNPQESPIQVIKKDENGNNVLDKYGRLQWEDTDKTQKVYRIKYLKVDGNETDQANAVCTAAYVGCTYHCG